MPADFRSLHDAAHAAGIAAGLAAVPTPMTVVQHSNVLDDRSPISRSWNVPEGPCGFAYVRMKGNTPFARWAKAAGIGHPGYPSGFEIGARATLPSGHYAQSITRNEAYARAYANTLKAAGIDCYSYSRLD